MASSSYKDDLSCSICLAIFTDPVCLPCGHSFCRECATNALSSKAQCPHCQMTVPTEKYLPTNYILRSLAEKAKIPDSLCPEHEEKLKLFCETDQQLACVICRDGKRHDGHKFKPIKEAAESLRQQLEKGITTLTGDISAIESTASRQKEAISAAQKKSQELRDQISTQFEEMHQFLRKREEEINADLEKKHRQAVEKMSERLKVMDEAIAESREVEARARSALEISDTQGFLQRWSDGDAKAAKNVLFSSRAGELQVASESFSFGPYETHLQFFVWKEMLQVVQPLPERLSLRGDNTNIRVSQDGRSLLCAPLTNHKGSVEQPNSFFFSTVQSHPKGSIQQPQSSLFGAPQSERPPLSSILDRKPLGALQTPLSSILDTSLSKPQGAVQPQASGFTFAPSVFVNPGKYATSSTYQFTYGQHYWEVEVGLGDFWELGIGKNLLRYEGQNFNAIHNSSSEQLPYAGRPRKIGVYLDCSSKELSFYNADTMEHIVTITSCTWSPPQAAYFNIRYSDQPNPLTVCWY